MLDSKWVKYMLLKGDGVVTNKNAESFNIHRAYLSELVKYGKLERVAPGLYLPLDSEQDAMQLYQMNKKRMVYSHETALYLHGLSKVFPLTYSVTVPAGYNTSKLNSDGMIVHTIKKELFEFGLCIRQTYFGNDVKTYDMERTLCDVLRDRKRQDISVITEAIKRYDSHNEKNREKLLEYSKILRIEKVMKDFLAVAGVYW